MKKFIFIMFVICGVGCSFAASRDPHRALEVQMEKMCAAAAAGRDSVLISSVMTQLDAYVYGKEGRFFSSYKPDQRGGVFKMYFENYFSSIDALAPSPVARFIQTYFIGTAYELDQIPVSDKDRFFSLLTMVCNENIHAATLLKKEVEIMLFEGARPFYSGAASAVTVGNYYNRRDVDGALSVSTYNKLSQELAEVNTDRDLTLDYTKCYMVLRALRSSGAGRLGFIELAGLLGVRNPAVSAVLLTSSPDADARLRELITDASTRSKDCGAGRGDAGEGLVDPLVSSVLKRNPERYNGDSTFINQLKEMPWYGCDAAIVLFEWGLIDVDDFKVVLERGMARTDERVKAAESKVRESKER